MHIGVPGHGIVIAVPIKSVGGGKTVAFLNGETDNAAYTPSLNYAHELIVAVCSQGCTDMVMNAARAAGARGGTVLHNCAGKRDDPDRCSSFPKDSYNAVYPKKSRS